MSVSTMLAIAPLTAEQVDRWTDRFDGLSAEVASSAVVTAGLQAWSRSDAFAADDVQRLFWHAMADWALLAELGGEIDVDGDGVEILVVRKLAPMAVLMTGLGWRRAHRLPGVAGLWLLSPEGVRAVAGVVERVFGLSQAERAAVRERMAQALLVGDEPDLDLDRLLDAVPRAFEAAAALDMGLVSCSAVV